LIPKPVKNHTQIAVVRLLFGRLMPAMVVVKIAAIKAGGMLEPCLKFRAELP
jgi:hypothetical protein